MGADNDYKVKYIYSTKFYVLQPNEISTSNFCGFVFRRKIKMINKILVLINY